MSDPYAGTVTVRNILNHIISPKIVSDGFSGYTTRVDLVNVDSLVLNSGTGNGSSGSPFTGQFGVISGSIASGASSATLTINHQYVTVDSVILLTVTNSATSASAAIVSVSNGSFIANVRGLLASPYKLNWFIVKF